MIAGMKRYLLLLALSVYAQAQSVPVGSGIPQAVRVSASYTGTRGSVAIYYFVCARYPAGYNCSTQPATAGGTTGISGLGGGNSVTVSWTGASGATGYDVIRMGTNGGFSGSCSNGCAIALNLSATTYVDSSSGSGSNYPPGGLSPILGAPGTIALDNLDYAPPSLVWLFGGQEQQFCFAGSTNPGCAFSGGGITQLTQDVLAGPGAGSQPATVVGIDTVPLCSGFSPTSGQFLEYTTGLSPVPCYTAAAASGTGIQFNGVPTATAIVTDFDATHVQTPNALTTLDSSGDMAVNGTASVVGPLNVGSGSGDATQLFLYTADGNSVLWSGAATGVTATESWAAWNPTGNGQVPESSSCSGNSCTITWATLPAAGITQLTGDVTAGPGSGSQVATLATVNTGPGSCGDATHVCAITTNGKGLTTAQTATAITGLTTTNQNIRTITADFGDSTSGAVAITGSPIACTGKIFFSGTIQEVSITAAPSGSATIDVRVATFANYTTSGPSATASIAASDIPALSSSFTYDDTTLTGWTTSLAAGSVFCFYMTSPSTITAAQLTLKVAAN